MALIDTIVHMYNLLAACDNVKPDDFPFFVLNMSKGRKNIRSNSCVVITGSKEDGIPRVMGTIVGSNLHHWHVSVERDKFRPALLRMIEIEEILDNTKDDTQNG